MLTMTEPNKTLKRDFRNNLILILLVIGLAVIPFFIVENADFEGADCEAQVAINEINNDYQPWFAPIFEPASGEIEGLLFALQAAIGAGVIGFGLGYLKGRSNKKQC